MSKSITTPKSLQQMVIHTRVTPALKDSAKEILKGQGLTVSEYVRLCLEDLVRRCGTEAMQHQVEMQGKTTRENENQ